ncbi:short-chain dehydrogenase/reductase, partial [Rossellomorea marisflavi]
WAGRSSIKTKTAIYKETVEPTISTMAEYSGQEPGNPKKAAEAMISIVETENPPLRLLLGETAYQVATHKYQNLLQDIETWKDTSLGADFK